MSAAKTRRGQRRPARKIAIIEYGMGNLASVANALKRLSANFFLSHDLSELSSADAYILPGVGAFAAAMANLRKLGLPQLLNREVREKGKPFLGICLGMQVVAEDSTEGELTEGFGWIPGHVVRMSPGEGHHVPHVGWNTVEWEDSHPLFRGIDRGAHFYFDHSYWFDELASGRSATCTYGRSFAAAIAEGNVFATQFHPEKSQRNGLKLLRNYLNLVECAAGPGRAEPSC